MSTLQDIIDQKAKQRLNKDIDQFLTDLTNSKYFRPVAHLMLERVEDKVVTLNSFFYHNTGDARKVIFDELFPEYQAVESERFYDLAMTEGRQL